MSKNLRASGSPRRASRRLLRTLLPLGGLFSGACTFTNDTVSSVPLQPNQVQFYSQNHVLLQAVSDFCANLEWTTCASPEFTDDQAFMGANKQTYGPPAFIAPAESLNFYTGDNSFQAAPVLVAYVHVLQDTTPLPSTYTDLKLNYGENCVYLFHQLGLFKAYVMPKQNDTCPTYSPQPQHQLNVQAISSANFPDHTDIPPVARFHEGNKGQSAGVPFLGMKCGDKWCLVLAEGQGQPVSEWKPPHDGVHNERRSWSVYGWNDSQHLALANQGAPGLMRSTMRASIVAVPNLATITLAQYAQGFQHVATVYFTGGTSGKYKNSWQYRKGYNEVFLMMNPDSTWKAELRRTIYIGNFPIVTWVTPASVDRRPHNVAPPGTARFLWTTTDEDLWIACDAGCCRVAGE